MTEANDRYPLNMGSPRVRALIDIAYDAIQDRNTASDQIGKYRDALEQAQREYFQAEHVIESARELLRSVNGWPDAPDPLELDELITSAREPEPGPGPSAFDFISGPIVDDNNTDESK